MLLKKTLVQECLQTFWRMEMTVYDQSSVLMQDVSSTVEVGAETVIHIEQWATYKQKKTEDTYQNRVECAIQHDICSSQIVGNGIGAWNELNIQVLRKYHAMPQIYVDYFSHLYTFGLDDISLSDLLYPLDHFGFVLVSFAQLGRHTQD